MKIFDTPNNNAEIMKIEDMSVRGKLFSIRLVKGEPGKISSSGYLAELYLEDDENYFLKCNMDADWLTDLEEVSGEAHDNWKSAQIRPFPGYGTIMTLQEFIDDVTHGYFIDDDGEGCYATVDGMTEISISPSDIRNGSINRTYTHVIWFNK